MKQYKKAIIKNNKIVSFKCDFCGKKERANLCGWWGGVNIHMTGGYGSTELDFDHMELDICDNCFKNKFGKFKNKIVDTI